MRYRVVQQITRQSEAFQYIWRPHTLNFTPFPWGVLLAEDGETLCGTEIHGICFISPVRRSRWFASWLMLEKCLPSSLTSRPEGK